MELKQVVTRRRSVRSFTGSVSAETIKAVLDAAQTAPVGMAKYDTLHLTVIQNKDLLNQIDRNGAEFFKDPSRTPLYGAPCLILISTPIENPAMSNVPYSNAAIMAEHMALTATDMGIGSCLIWGAIAALNTKPELVAKLNLPQGHVPCCGVVIGDTDIAFEEREIPTDRVAVSYLS